MTEVYRALGHLNCEWKMVNSYRIKCKWMPNAQAGFQGQQGGGLFAAFKGGNNQPGPRQRPDYHIIIALSLYKVQQHIYLLDFQKVDGDSFTFMELCAKIITQLKALSAQSKAMQLAAAQQQLHSQHHQAQQQAVGPQIHQNMQQVPPHIHAQMIHQQQLQASRMHVQYQSQGGPPHVIPQFNPNDPRGMPPQPPGSTPGQGPAPGPTM